MKSPNINTDTVSIHALHDTTQEKLDLFTDSGRFANDLALHGLDLVISSKLTFDEGRAQSVSRNVAGETSYGETSIDPDRVAAMHVRLIGKVNRPGTEGVPKINTNALKGLAGSKYDLYNRVLKQDQVPTHFMSMEVDDFEATVDAINAVETENVVIKSNSGAGGYSTKIRSKMDAIDWVRNTMGTDDAKPQILQAQIMPGSLPAGISGTDEYSRSLIERTRKETLLHELRMFAIKRGDECDVVPVLRVVPDKNLPMQGRNDDYLDVEIEDELLTALALSSKRIMDTACVESGAGDFALGAIDYYFDDDGLPHVMEANLRSPQLPSTNDTPLAGRAAHASLALSFRQMIDQRNDA